MSYPGTFEEAKSTIKKIEHPRDGGTSPILSGGGGGLRSSDMSKGTNTVVKKKTSKQPFQNVGKGKY